MRLSLQIHCNLVDGAMKVDPSLIPREKEKFKNRKKNQMELLLRLFERFRASSRYFRAVIPNIFQGLCFIPLLYEVASDVWEMSMDDNMKEKGFLAVSKVFVHMRMHEVMKEVASVARTRDRTGFIGAVTDEVLVGILMRGFPLFGTEGTDEIRMRELAMNKLETEISEGKTDLGSLKVVMKEWWVGLDDESRSRFEESCVPSLSCWNWWENCEDWQRQYCEKIRSLFGCG